MITQTSQIYSSSSPIQNFSEMRRECFLEQVDIFSQDTFENIRKSHFENAIDFYVVILKENNRDFYFEGSKFIEAYFRSQETKKPFINPLTRNVVECFKVLKSTKDKPSFVEIFDEKSCKYEADCLNEKSSKSRLNCLIILVNCLHQPDAFKAKIYYRIGDIYKDRLNDDEQAMNYYRQSANLGHKSAKYQLAQILKNAGHLKESVGWLIEFWQNDFHAFSIEGLVNLGIACKEADLTKEALSFFEKGAFLGNPYAICMTIEICRSDLDDINNRLKSEFWLQFLPSDFQKLPIRDYLRIVCADPEASTITRLLEIPADWLEQEKLINLPTRHSIT